MTILRPKALRTADLVAVAALSGGLDRDEAALFASGVGTLERIGFVVHVSSLVDLNRRRWWAATSPTEVAEEFNLLLRDPRVRVTLLKAIVS